MNGFIRRAAGSLLLFFSAVAGAQGLAGNKPQFFSQPPGITRAANAPGVQSQAAAVRFNAADMLDLRYLDEIQLTLPNGTTHTVVFELATPHGHGVTSWVGRIKDQGTHSRVIITTGPGGSFGIIDTPEGSYRIVPGEGHDWLVDMTEEQLYIPITRLENDAIVDRTVEKAAVDLSKARFEIAIPGVNTVGTSKATPTPQAVIDLMIVVTRGLADRLGTTLATRLNFLVTRSNTSYADSEIAMTLRLVNFTVVDYPDNTSDSVSLGSITPTCTTQFCAAAFNAAVFGNIENIRTQYGADMVALLRNGSSFGGSGVAWVPAPTNANLMYSTVQGCVLGCESVFIHELGHNMGNMHDRATTQWQDGGTVTPDQGTFPYSYGYAFCKSGALTCNPSLLNGTPGACVTGGTQPECSTADPSSFSDIMAYFHGTTNRIYKFSNPNVACRSTATGQDNSDRPCGVSELAANSANTALSMNTNRTAISALRATVAATNMPGSLQFTASGYNGTETGGTITFTVSRINGSGGAVSVSYAVTGGSAISGVDFAVASGTLSWADGVSASQPFTVTITNDLAVEGIEAFTATLSNPVGTAGVYLGYPTTATALILENWPVGGTVPAGWTAVGGGAPWAIASDASFDGDNISLKSGALAFVCPPTCSSPIPTPAPSGIQYIGTFPTGAVSFAYQVNSYPGTGLFEFLIDDAVVMSDSGVPGWKTFSTNLTAGSRKLLWRFRSTLGFPCANTIPAAHADCVDRAWIDSISLPTTLASSATTLATSANPASSGQTVTLTATVSGGAGSPTGTVAFRAGSALISGCTAAAVSGSSAACATSALAVGSHSITASYSGSLTYAASTSTVLTQTIATVTNVALTVTKIGAGSGTVTSSPGAINCGATCTDSFPSGTAVTLTASPALGSLFLGWSGACSGISTCQVTPTSATTVTANFAAAAATPTGAANPTSLDFGGQSIQTTSGALAVVLTNVGTGTLTVTGALLSNANYAQTNNCTTTLATGATCTATVTFTPGAQGALAGTLTFATSGGNVTVTLAGSGERSLVTHYYRAILNRAPEAGGKAFWEAEAARLAALGADPNETWYVMAGYFFSSAEYLAANKNDAQFVTDLYNTFFNRAPDAGGLGYWTGQIAGGLPREVVLFSFMFSTEFRTFAQGIFGSTSARPEVNMVMDFFRGVLNRIPDTAAYNYWVGQLRTAQCQGAGAVYNKVSEISYAFIFGSEYSGRARNNTQFVTDMYYSFLRRGGDTAGVNFWINQINTAAKDRNTVRADFIASPEFGARVTAVIAAGCAP